MDQYEAAIQAAARLARQGDENAMAELQALLAKREQLQLGNQSEYNKQFGMGPQAVQGIASFFGGKGPLGQMRDRENADIKRLQAAREAAGYASGGMVHRCPMCGK